MSDVHQPLTNSVADGSVVADLIEAWLKQVQAGEPPEVEAFLAQHPQHADRLRQLIPAAQVLAELGQSAGKELSFPPRAPGGEIALGMLGDYRIVREVGRGGMGVVYEAEQISLGRRVALKVLPFAATMDPRQLQRFANEARAAASLDHPHIVKIHGVSQERGVHFYAMQFIDGRTLADYVRQHRLQPDRKAQLLSVVSDATQAYRPAHDHPVDTATPPDQSTAATRQSTQKSCVRDSAYFRNVARLGVQAAEALEHAHTLGIVHRDIKPANLMLDEKGDLWITDFGLARTAADTGLTLTGDVLGTLRYMSPEQALAAHGLVDHRTDIYALGATLYELLTLQPAIDGKDRQEILHRIAFEEPAAPRKLDSTIPAELETVVLKSMAKNAAERYATAKELADDLQRFLNDEPIKARRPTWRQRARRFARRHRPLVAGAVASAVVGLIALATGGVWYYVQQVEAQAEADSRQALTEQDFGSALAEAKGHRDDLHKLLRQPGGVFKLLNNPSRWQTQIHLAQGALERAAAVASRAESPIPEAQLEMMQELKEHLDNDEAERSVALALEDVHLKRAAVVDGMIDYAGAIRAYHKVFANAGLDVLKGEAGEVAKRIEQFAIKELLAASLDDWGLVEMLVPGNAEKGVQVWERLLLVARKADPGLWKDKLRNARLWRDSKVLAELAAEAPVAELSPQMLVVVGVLLDIRGLDAAGWLRQAHILHPSDFWINLTLGNVLIEEHPGDAAGFYRAALAVRESSTVYFNLSSALQRHDQWVEAELVYRKIIALQKKSADLQDNLAAAYFGLGTSLSEQKKYVEAIAALDDAIKLEPAHVMAHFNLGVTHAAHGNLAEAVLAYRNAIKLDHDNFDAHYNLGNALTEQKKFSEAETAYDQAIRIKPTFAAPYHNLGVALLEQNKLPEAEKILRKAAGLDQNSADTYLSLGNVLAKQKMFHAAEDAYRRSAMLKADAHTYYCLGDALFNQQKLPEAEKAFFEATRLKQDYAEVYCAWGLALGQQNKLSEAEKVLRKAVQLKSSFKKPGRLAGACVNLGNVLQLQNRLTEAEQFYRQAADLEPSLPDAHYNLGLILLKQNRPAEAEKALRQAVQLKPDAAGYNNLANALLDQGKLDEAEEELRKAIALQPNYPNARVGLGEVLLKQGKFSEAILELQQVLAKLPPGHPLHSSGQSYLQNCQQLLALEAKLPAALQERQTGADELLALADLCRRYKKCYADAVKLYTAAFAAKADLPRDKTFLHQYNAAGAAALAAAGKGKGADKLDAKEQTKMRQHALNWLKANLKLRSMQIQQGIPQDILAAKKDLAHWQTDPDLASIRSKEALAALPNEERQAWQQLWVEVEQFVKQGPAKSKVTNP